ncbi:MAG: hypothetical protein AB2L14_01505 [Candidatus Xenobiia bacterium LiM19]
MVSTTETGMGITAAWSSENSKGRRRKKRKLCSTVSDLSESLPEMESDPSSQGDASCGGCGFEDSPELPLSWMPLYCERALRSAVDRHELVIFVKTARMDLHRRMDSYFSYYNALKNEYFTVEERKAIEIADSLKTGELMGNHRTLKSFEKYLKTDSRAHLIRAREHYRNAEKVWKRLIEHLKEFVMINLLGRRSLSF